MIPILCISATSIDEGTLIEHLPSKPGLTCAELKAVRAMII